MVFISESSAAIFLASCGLSFIFRLLYSFPNFNAAFVVDTWHASAIFFKELIKSEFCVVSERISISIPR